MCKTVLTYMFMNLDSRGLDIHSMASLSEVRCRKVVNEAGTTFPVVVFQLFVEAKRPFPLIHESRRLQMICVFVQEALSFSSPSVFSPGIILHSRRIHGIGCANRLKTGLRNDVSFRVSESRHEG